LCLCLISYTKNTSEHEAKMNFEKYFKKSKKRG
jgi:hypothetical protein